MSRELEARRREEREIEERRLEREHMRQERELEDRRSEREEMRLRHVELMAVITRSITPQPPQVNITQSRS